MSIRVIRPGTSTTIQDLGRRGLQRYGVSVGGAMDTFSLRVANWLVGNTDSSAVLEMTMLGPTLRFERDALLACCGALYTPRLNGDVFPLGRPVFVRANSKLIFGAAIAGRFAYLAIAGGIDVPPVLSSRSTDVRASIGGLEGRGLRERDLLPIDEPSSVTQRVMDRWRERQANETTFFPAWHVDALGNGNAEGMSLRVIPGSELNWLSPEDQIAFFNVSYTVSPQSDRMGYRLAGPALNLAESKELISEAVCRGTIQLPPGGQPILLMADCATTGGYAKIAHVASIDLPLAAQARPGTKLRFVPIGVEEAHMLLRQRERELSLMKQGIALKLTEL